MRLPGLALSVMLLVLAPACGRSGRTAKSPPPSPKPATATAPTEGERPPAARATLPVPSLGYNAREGQAIYRHYCSTCHGEEGHGDGFNAFNLDPKPRDLGDATFQAKRSDEDLMAVIRSGGGAAGLSTAMPPWERTLGDRKIRNVVDYLRTLSPKPQ